MGALARLVGVGRAADNVVTEAAMAEVRLVSREWSRAAQAAMAGSVKVLVGGSARLAARGWAGLVRLVARGWSVCGHGLGNGAAAMGGRQ
ncbi:hypothetical protein TIFTF001_048855 [Ficus carica]|uniref:Uncharacterized protein n=1 Tax=Ficus carica TaxID=3494 RepID=A0AA88CLR4_FICCA|nr:hypothetical protein TIFTF001_048855 [Ficus carica]